MHAGDVEEFSLPAIVTGRSGNNEIELNITSAALRHAKLYALDTATIAAGAELLPVRILSASIAGAYLDDAALHGDVDASAALVFDDSSGNTSVRLVGYGSGIANALQAHPGMRLEIRVRRYRLPDGTTPDE